MLLFNMLDTAYQLHVQISLLSFQKESMSKLNVASITVGLANAFYQIWNEIAAGRASQQMIHDADLYKSFQNVAARRMTQNQWPADGDVDFLWNSLSQEDNP